MTDLVSVQVCTQVQRAGAHWFSKQYSKALEELKKAPYDAAVSKAVRNCKSFLCFRFSDIDHPVLLCAGRPQQGCLDPPAAQPQG